MKIRPTGILIEDGKILLLNQDVNNGRKWSLPGGALESGETLEQCLIREMKEETGLDIKIKKLLYVCDFLKDDLYILHITFLIDRLNGSLGKTTNIDTNEIREVKMVPIGELEQLGFSPVFAGLINNDFPDAGSYKGAKSNIGL